MVQELSHFVGGKRVPGASNKFGDVYDPNTGEVQARVPLADKAETEAIIANAVEAQREWALFNPQKRARVLMKFLQLVQEEMDSLARLLSSEHGKTIPDAKGDIQRGLEVIEFALGAPHLLKGEYTESAGTGIDVYSMRQPLGVVAGITPFNFPAMIPLWKAGPALAAGNASSSSRPSATPRCRCAWPNCSSRPVCPRVCSTWSTVTRKWWTSCSPTTASRLSGSSGPPRSRSTSTRPPRPTASAHNASVARRTTRSSCPTPTSTRWQTPHRRWLRLRG